MKNEKAINKEVHMVNKRCEIFFNKHERKIGTNESIPQQEHKSP